MKIAILLSRVPFPLEKGDKLRAFHQIKVLSERHELYLFALNDSRLHPDARKELEPYCKEVHIYPLPWLGRVWHAIRFFLTGKPLQCGYFYRPSVQREVARQCRRIGVERVYCQL
ncbi:MAG: hypothetical protein IKN37_06795, partial [Bacteroidales bacterium]|nr:hypothetical protein [Bacteroidales bacterium]